MYRSLGLLFALVTSGSGLAHAADPARQIAETSAAQWNAAFAQGKVDAIVSLYTDNALLLRPDGAVARGVGEIRAFWQNVIQQGDYAMNIVDASSEDGTIVATAELSGVKVEANHQPASKYRYGGVLYSVLQRQPDGSWKAKVQKWNDDHKI
jgi:ketosteroid isomerase-like protein